MLSFPSAVCLTILSTPPHEPSTHLHSQMPASLKSPFPDNAGKPLRLGTWMAEYFRTSGWEKGGGGEEKEAHGQRALPDALGPSSYPISGYADTSPFTTFHNSSFNCWAHTFLFFKEISCLTVSTC